MEHNVRILKEFIQLHNRKTLFQCLLWSYMLVETCKISQPGLLLSQ